MNNQVNNTSNSCQFYVVLNKGEMILPQDGNVYIDADQFQNDISKLRSAIVNAYQEKSNQHQIVNDKIIFCIPSENYRESAKVIMQEVGVTNGDIQVIPKKEEKVDRKVVTNTYENANNVAIGQGVLASPNSNDLEKKEVSYENNLGLNQNGSISENSQLNIQQGSISNNHETEAIEKKAEIPYSYQPDNVYRGDFKREDNLSNQSAFSNGYGSMRYDDARSDFTKERGPVRVKKKPNAFVNLPVIIFILSALLLISSAVLLFVLD